MTFGPASPETSVDDRGAPEVLVVDDDALILRRIGSVLRRAGFVVREADGGTSALDELSRRPPDVIIADYSMPDMDGLTLLSLVHRHWPDTARILLSGVLDVGLALLAEDAHLHAALPKPVAPGELRAAVKTALDCRQSERTGAEPPES